MGDCMSKSSELLLFRRKYFVNSREVPPFNTNKGFWFHYPEAFKKCLVLKIPEAQVCAGKPYRCTKPSSILHGAMLAFTAISSCSLISYGTTLTLFDKSIIA